MRSRKELIYLNIKDLTEEEIESLSDLELNSCDKCGEIESTYKLNWIDSEEFWDIKGIITELEKGNVALCDDCYNKIVDSPEN